MKRKGAVITEITVSYREQASRILYWPEISVPWKTMLVFWALERKRVLTKENNLTMGVNHL